MIYFYDTEGNPIAPASLLDLTGDLEVTADGALTISGEMEPLGALTISTHGRGELLTGSVKVISEGPIGGLLRFEHPDLGVAGVAAGPPLSDAIFPVRRQEGGTNTGIALHNLESSSGLLRCELLREGLLLDSVMISLETNGQTSWLIDAAFPGDRYVRLRWGRCAAPRQGRGCSLPWPWKWTPAPVLLRPCRWRRFQKCRLRNRRKAAATAGNPMNDACPSQRHESAYPRSNLFERRRRRMDDCASVTFPIQASFYFFKLPSLWHRSPAASSGWPNWAAPVPTNPPTTTFGVISTSPAQVSPPATTGRGPSQRRREAGLSIAALLAPGLHRVTAPVTQIRG